MTKFFIIFSVLISLSFSAFGQDYKIEELLEIARTNSANIKSAEYLSESQKHFAEQQKYWTNPIVGFGRIAGQNNYSVTQTIPFYNKLQNRYDIEKAQYLALDARKNNVALFVKTEVFRLLYQYVSIKKQIELTQKRLDRLSLVEQYLSTIVLSSPTKKAQWHITKDRIKLVKRDLIKFKNQLYQTWNAANIYLNLEQEPTNITLQWLSDENYQGKKFFIEKALTNNWELKEQKNLINKSKSELSYAKIEQMPDVNISAMRENGSNSSNIGNRNATGFGLELSVPLLNRNQEKIIFATSNIKAQEAAYEFQRQQLIGLISNDISEYETALQISKNFRIADINQIILRLSEANSDFKKGVLDFITYIELDSQEYQAIDAIINTQIDLAASYSALMLKVGSFSFPNVKGVKDAE